MSRRVRIWFDEKGKEKILSMRPTLLRMQVYCTVLTRNFSTCIGYMRGMSPIQRATQASKSKHVVPWSTSSCPPPYALSDLTCTLGVFVPDFFPAM